MSTAPILPQREIVDGPTPKHAQLREILAEVCRSTLKPGDPLPGERLLEEFYGYPELRFAARLVISLLRAGFAEYAARARSLRPIHWYLGFTWRLFPMRWARRMSLLVRESCSRDAPQLPRM